jgi:hypothetical protein
MVEEQKRIHLEVPSMVRPGTICEIPIHGLGIHNFYIRLHISIG